MFWAAPVAELMLKNAPFQFSASVSNPMGRMRESGVLLETATLAHLCNREQRVQLIWRPDFHGWSPDWFLSHSRAALRANARTKARSAGLELNFLPTSSVSAVGPCNDRTVLRFAPGTSDRVRFVPMRARLFPEQPTRDRLMV